MSKANETLRFAQLQSVVDVTFLAELSEHKLNVLKLSEAPVDIIGHFSPNRYESVGARLQLDVSSLRPDATSRPDCHAAPGQLLLFNTIEGFRDCDKPALMRQAASQVWSDIVSGAAETEPWRLCRFLVLMHGDLKHYKFHYWFAFPALRPPVPFACEGPPTRVKDLLPSAAVEAIAAACTSWRYPSTSPTSAAGLSAAAPATAPTAEPPVALAATTPADVLSRSPPPFWLLSSPEPDFSGTVTAHPLSSWARLTARGVTDGDKGGEAGEGAAAAGRHVLLVVSDSSNLEAHPTWHLRNALLMAAVRWKVERLRVLCLRESSRGGGRLDPQRSLLLTVVLPRVEQAAWPPGQQQQPQQQRHGGGGPAADAAGPVPTATESAGDPGCPDAVGWEANALGRLLPRFLDLGPHLRPEAQAEQAVDLNLRLMRWRAVPELDVGAMAATKCLLLGAGTLGCAVGRTLQAWGVRHVTLVDSGRVAFSNPVRQSLYNFEDCLGGGRPKAEAAAEALRRIFPSAVTQGLALTIPMPGHPPGGPEEEAALQQATQQLDRLVLEHDAVFLLTDTRESRWLPALLAAAHGKIAITAAVGFDSFLVMRHGAPPGRANAPCNASAAGSGVAPEEGGRRLGCYFCNDVFAPANSTRDRSLDQQCTVARPGLAPVAGALAVELLAAVVQQRAGVCAPPPTVQEQQGGPSPPLGSAPHMIRGQLSTFSQVAMEGWAFAQCTACSAAVVQAYRQQGWDLVRAALLAPASLEALTGLSELHAAAAAMMESDEEEEDGEEGEKEKGRESGSGAADDKTKKLTDGAGGETASGKRGSGTERAGEWQSGDGVQGSAADDDNDWTAL